jgi:hypothetical protein
MSGGRAVIERTVLVLALVVASALLVAACAFSPAVESISYSVVERPGGVTATIADTRAGEFTDWLVLRDRSGRQVGVLTSRNLGDHGPDESDSASAEVDLEPGTYRYALYEVDRVVNSGGSSYWTDEYRAAAGEVKVP